jgi:hypothetical protein
VSCAVAPRFKAEVVKTPVSVKVAKLGSVIVGVGVRTILSVCEIIAVSTRMFPVGVSVRPAAVALNVTQMSGGGSTGQTAAAAGATAAPVKNKLPDATASR